MGEIWQLERGSAAGRWPARRSPSRAPARLALATAALALALALILGLAVGVGISPALPLAAVVGLAALAVGIRDWRSSVTGLLLFLPVSGIPIIATYPSTGPATLLKDLLFVGPAYVGFGLALAAGRQRWRVPGFPLLPALALVALVVVQMANPDVPNLLVALIGAKVWLLYLPMAVLGYHWVRTIDDLDRMLRLMCLTAVPVCLLGIVEGVLVNTGRGATVYAWYGDAAVAVTQGFAAIEAGGASINRVSSTFSFVTQYYLFTVVMLPVAFAFWHGRFGSGHGRRGLGVGLVGLIALASALSGARAALLSMPLMLLAMLLLVGVRPRTLLASAAAAGVAVVATVGVLGAGIRPLFQDLLQHASDEFGINTRDGFAFALDRGLTGLGTGVDTVSARYALPEVNPFAALGGGFRESWWVKSLLELGVAGLVTTACLLGAILVVGLRTRRGLRDPRLRSVSAGILALVGFIVVYNFKGSYLDLDPMNVLFWLLVGVLLRLPALDRDPGGARSPAAGLP